MLTKTSNKNQCLIGLVLLCFSYQSSAGILGDLGSMFMSNATAPSQLSSRDRMGAFGGSFEMRTPIKNANIVAFDPPRLDAGCGGVDLYGGSFSFINGKQLIQIFRSVASNAAGLAFKAAIKIISPSLDQLITEFQSLMQNLNNLAKNSCNLAHMLVDPAEAAISNAVNGDGAVGSTNSGMFSDMFGGLTQYLSDANQYLSKAGGVNPRVGNQIVKAVLASGSSSTMGLAGLGNPDGSADDPTNPNSLNNRLLYSMLGYRIDGVPCAGANAQGVSTTSQSQSGNNIPRISCSSPPTISMINLIDGGGPGSAEPSTPLKLYSCRNPNGDGNGGFDPQICTFMEKDNFNYVGVRGWVNTMLFGSGDTTGGLAAVQPTSILGKFNSGTSVTLSPNQIQFVKQAGNRLVALLSKTSNPDERYSIAYRLAGNITECVAAKLGSSIYLGANSIQSDNSYALTDDQKRAIENLRQDTLNLRERCIKDETVARIVIEMNESAKLTNITNR